MDFFLGGIIQFGGNFPPKDWAFCEGQLVSISENQALYAILSTNWGGDGRTNFALPDMRSRVPIGAGIGIGLSEVIIGQKGGTENHTLREAQMPSHSHPATFNPITSPGGISATTTINAYNGTGNKNSASGNYWATGNATSGLTSLNVENGYADTSDSTMATDAVTVNVTGGGGITGGTVTNGASGGNQSFSLMQPSLGIEFIICMQGIFPTRN